MDDVMLNKAATIERCISRIRAEYDGNPRNLIDDITRQDSILLNLQRACETAIDLAMHMVRIHALGAPQDSRDAFDFLARAGIVETDLATKLKKMVGFRNLAVHDDQTLDMAIVRSVIEQRLPDLSAFSALALARAGLPNDRETPGPHKVTPP